MKKLLLLVTLILSFMALSAQSGSWKIRLNSKTLLTTSVENEEKNIRKVTAAEWKKNGHLEISFKEPGPKIWKRSFLLFDENDEQLWEADSTMSTRISLIELRKIFKGKKQLRIYTIVTPLDPNIAVRIRRVHLCTLRLP